MRKKNTNLYRSIMSNINESFRRMKLNETLLIDDDDFDENDEEYSEPLTVEQYWDKLIEYEIATEDELKLVTCIDGYSIDTLDSVLYARTGYRDWEQYSESE